MPIIYMHGVNTRDPKHFEPIHEYLQRIVAPAISKDPKSVSIVAADWYGACAPPKWGGISRPRTQLLGQGAETMRIEALDAILEKVPRESAPASGAFTSGQAAPAAASARLEKISDGDLADLIALAIPGPATETTQRARIGVAADRVARNPVIRQKLAAATSLDDQLRILADAVQHDVEQQSTLAAAGVADFLRDMKDRIGEGISRTLSKPAVAASTLAGELRPNLSDFVTRFLGDVLFYIDGRGSRAAPGRIPSVLIAALETAQINKDNRGGEPIVLLTHSMGGQIAYDVITAFLPTAKSRIKVDFWCATASQVGFFEELNMFLASSNDYSKATGKPTPLDTTHLGHWWNVWDNNDIVSFTTEGIFAKGIDDKEFSTGMSLVAAHGGYLERPSFYRLFADKLEAVFPGKGL